jgi:monoamine oxidase
MSPVISRRRLLAAGLTGLSTLGLRSSVGRLLAGEPELDAVIIGAGFAGLSTARQLMKAGKTFVLLEARDRVGGRTKTEQLLGRIKIDVGGQWIGPEQKRVSALAAELGAETFSTYDDGTHLFDEMGRIKRYQGSVPGFPGIWGYLSTLNMGTAMWQLDRMARKVNLAEPWKTPNAKYLDSVTLGHWTKHHLPMTPARHLFDAGLKMIFAADPDELSLLHALFYIRSAGDINQLVAVKGGAQASRFKYGTADLTTRIAAPFTDRIRFNTVVKAIQQDGSGVTVRTESGSIRARRVVVTVPPRLVEQIDFAPGLPDARVQLIKRMPMGAVAKCMAVYPTPFWRSKGMSGQTVSTGELITATFDNSVPYAPDGVLLGFAVGTYAEKLRLLSPEERQKTVLGLFTRWFGKEAATPTHYVDHTWKDETWSQGCYSAILPTGVWTGFGTALRAPSGRIHWAGTETATEWNGYMDGAIQSGERAAAEILAAGV